MVVGKMRSRTTCFGTIFATITIAVTIIQCQELPILNQECSRRSNCAPFGYVCNVNNRTCQCDRNFIPDRNFEKCVGGLDQRCQYDDDCIRGAFCQHQVKCKCKENYYASDDGLSCSRSNNLKPKPYSLLIGMCILSATLQKCNMF